ncbi:MAG: hypothetical protein L0Y72_14100 [Gemmataceae bacterium]|nr:hypothetical protein [Gemmataceae bacterium]MCI0740175.1 hypothetical protein [Gemmataceae bacterium]
MHKKHAGQGLEIITVSLDASAHELEKAHKIALKFLQSKGATFTNLLLNESDEFWQTTFRISAPPAYYVFNRQGKWTLFKAEGDKEIDYTAMDKLIVELLREKPS